MLTFVKLSPRKFVLVDVSPVEGWHAAERSEQGYVVHSNRIVATGTWKDCYTAAQEYASARKNLLTYEEWKQKT